MVKLETTPPLPPPLKPLHTEVLRMKVMLSENALGKLLVYVAKKDLEEEVVSQTADGDNQIFTLSNGWELSIAGLTDPIKLPQTVDAKRLT